MQLRCQEMLNIEDLGKAYGEFDKAVQAGAKDNLNLSCQNRLLAPAMRCPSNIDIALICESCVLVPIKYHQIESFKLQHTEIRTCTWIYDTCMYVMYCNVMSCHVISCHVMSCHVMQCMQVQSSTYSLYQYVCSFGGRIWRISQTCAWSLCCCRQVKGSVILPL